MSLHIPADVLARLWPQAPARLRSAIVEQLPAVCERRKITTRLRLVHFLAQISHESGGGSIVRESMRYSAERITQIFGKGHSAKVGWAEAQRLGADAKKTGGVALAERVYGLGNPRMARDLGNTEPGDGWKFRGGGLLQETGRDAYEAASRVSGVDLIAEPDKIADPDFALDVAAAAFATYRILAACDRDDIDAVTRGVNGGRNGLADRRDWYARWSLALRDLDLTVEGEPTTGPAEPQTLEFGRRGWRVEALQRRLAALGYPVGRVDGRFGDQTRAAVLDLQAREGLPTTGIVDTATQDALDHAGPREVSAARAAATATDVADHPAIEAATGVATVAKSGGVAAALVAGVDGITERAASDPLGAAQEAVAKAGEVKGLAGQIADLGGSAVAWASAHPLAVAGVVVAVVAVVVVVRARGTVAAVVERYRTGLDMG